MVGSMGCISSLGLGVSLLQPQLETVIIDGDGAALMRMGNLACVGRYGGSNLTHIVLDNEVYDSTGGQATVSASVDFASIAANCGYATVVNGDDPALINAVVGDTGLPGPRLLHIKTRPGTIKDLARPNISPADLALRFMRYLL
jgi:phosphonopyruvate decarboxylase